MPDELEDRVDALETRVGDMERRLQHSEHDAAAARVLAGGADRDVGEIRQEIRDFRNQNNQLHNATRADLANHRARFDSLDRTLAGVRTSLDRVTAGQEQVVDMLNTLIERE